MVAGGQFAAVNTGWSGFQGRQAGICRDVSCRSIVAMCVLLLPSQLPEYLLAQVPNAFMLKWFIDSTST